MEFWAKLDGSKTNDALEQLGLSKLLDVPVRYLSTGQKKRAAFARLIAQNASIWLLDEPLNGLDSSGTELVEQLVREHCAIGGTTLAASHQSITLPGGKSIAIEDFAP